MNEDDDQLDAPEAAQPQAGETVDLDEDDATVEDTEDGGAILRLENEAQSARNTKHFENIVEDVDRAALRDTVVDLLEKIERDKESRKKRDELYEEGIRRTGLGKDAPGGADFTGASKVVHPLLVEGCVDFSARVLKELLPPNGPVKTKVFGPHDADKLAKAQRKADFMNWQLTQSITEFRGDMEQLATQLPLGGVQYLKFIWNADRRRCTTEFVPVDAMLLPFAATNFYSAERRTHVQNITSAEYRKRVKSGMYIDVDLPMPMEPEETRAQAANNKVEGKQSSTYNEDGLRTVFEITTFLDIETEGEFAPYILHVDNDTQKALGLFRNWDPDDEQREELDWVVEFPFIPWRGAYPIGLTHLIGGLSGAATGALRALLDSAHINNVPAGLRLKGGPNGSTINVVPATFAEIDGSGAVDDIRKLAMPLPFNPPSPVLFQLLGFLIDAGKGVIQTSFEKLADSNANAPVGTTLALIEQGMVVFSSIHARQHSAMERCFKILHRINSAYLTQEIITSYKVGLDIRPEDFDGDIDVMPVSDPAVFSETQRFARTQAVQQRAAMLPQLYDMRKVEEMFLHALKVDPDDVLVKQPGKDDRDPLSENVAATMGQAIYVLPKQDHIEHIKLHMAFLQSPLFGQNPAIVKTFLPPMARHLRDHALNYYLSEGHNAISKAKQFGLPIEGSEQEAALLLHTQQEVEQKLNGFDQMLAQIQQMADQMAQQNQPMPQDSSLQVAQLNAQTAAQISQQKLQAQAADNQMKLQSEQAKQQAEHQHDERMAQFEAQLEQLREQNRAMVEQLRQQSETARTTASNQSRERMNTADNTTAVNIAAAEIASGEHSAVSTGTGINPSP